MRNFIEWLQMSEWGLLITITSISLLIIIVVAYTPSRPTMVDDVDTTMMTAVDRADVWSTTTQQYVHDQVVILNSVEFSGVHDMLGIPHVYNYDWVETAFALDIPVDSLTILKYIKYIVRYE